MKIRIFSTLYKVKYVIAALALSELAEAQKAVKRRGGAFKGKKPENVSVRAQRAARERDHQNDHEHFSRLHQSRFKPARLEVFSPMRLRKG